MPPEFQSCLWTWKSYFLPNNPDTASGAGKLFMQYYYASGWESSFDDDMRESLNAFPEFMEGIQELSDCNAAGFAF